MHENTSPKEKSKVKVLNYFSLFTADLESTYTVKAR